MPPKPKRVASATVGTFAFFEVDRHTLATPSGGTRDVFTLRTRDWVTVAATTESGDFVLVRQHRHGVDAATIESAGGIVDDGEDPAIAGPRELLEETGYAGDAPIALGVVHPNPAMQDNRCHLYWVPRARLVGRPQNDESEHTEPLVMTRAEVRRALDDGRITHALAALVLERTLARLDADRP